MPGTNWLESSSHSMPRPIWWEEQLTMAKTLKRGDKVSWDSSGGHSTGKVVKKQTSPTQIKGHKVAASKDNPQYIVKSDKSGKVAAHQHGELKKA